MEYRAVPDGTGAPQAFALRGRENLVRLVGDNRAERGVARALAAHLRHDPVDNVIALPHALLEGTLGRVGVLADDADALRFSICAVGVTALARIEDALIAGGLNFEQCSRHPSHDALTAAQRP